MAVATKRKQKPRKAPSIKTIEDASPIRTVGHIQEDLARAREKLEATSTWMDGHDKAVERVIALERELDMAQVNALPQPDRMTWKVTEIDVDVTNINTNGNHRDEQRQDPAALQRLARSMAAVGLQQRIGVRVEGKSGKYVLIFGARRLAAAKINAWTTIAAKVYPPTLTAEQIEMLRTIENFNREDLSPVERAIAVARMLDSVDATLNAKEWDEEQQVLTKRVDAAGSKFAYVGQLLGRPESWVRDHAYVQKLGGKSRELLAVHRIDVAHARELAKLGDPAAADDLAEDVARDVQGLGGKDVTYLKQQVLEHTKSLRSVPWKLEVAFGKDEKAGCAGWACAECPHNSKSDPVLFAGGIGLPPTVLHDDEPAAAGVCTNARCFDVKMRAAERDITKGLEKVRAAVKSDGVALTETALAHLIPITIRGATFVRKCKAQIDPASGKTPADAPKSRGQQGKEPELTPEQKAKNEHQGKLNLWKRNAGKKIAAAIAKSPASLVYWVILSRATNGLQKLQEWHEPKHDQAARRIADQPQTKTQFKRLANPTFKDLIALGKQCDSPSEWDINRLVPEALACIADSLDLELGNPPDLDAMLKVEAATASKPAKKKGGKP